MTGLVLTVRAAMGQTSQRPLDAPPGVLVSDTDQAGYPTHGWTVGIAELEEPHKRRPTAD